MGPSPISQYRYKRNEIINLSNIVTFYANNGYPYTSISVSFSNDSGKFVPILNMILEKKYCFDTPLINSNLKLKQKLLQHDLRLLEVVQAHHLGLDLLHEGTQHR